jgi:hypothetical protein
MDVMLKYASLTRELPKVFEACVIRGERVILDYAKENVPPPRVDDVRRVTELMVSSIPAGHACALKFTSFGSRENVGRAVQHVKDIVDIAKDRGVSTCLDAEDVLYPTQSYDLMAENNTSDDAWVYKTYQMYRVSAMRELVGDLERARVDGFKIGVKLVRGAYIREQPGLFDTKRETDDSYNRALEVTLTNPNAHAILATHNDVSLRLAKRHPINRYSTAHLLGFGGEPDLRYVPYGRLVELLPYLWRRLLERASYKS